MGFSKRIKAYFEEKGLNNREVSKRMEGYSESLISRYMNSDDISSKFIGLLVKYFPEIDMNILLKDDEALQILSDVKEEYKTKNLLIVEDLEAKILELKNNLSR